MFKSFKSQSKNDNMEYKLIQYRDKDLKKFNDEINKYLKAGWELHGDYRVIVIDGNDREAGYVVNSQQLQREDDRVPMGFNVKK
jgi:hypothetical protein